MEKYISNKVVILQIKWIIFTSLIKIYYIVYLKSKLGRIYFKESDTPPL